ncbi:MAG: AsmA family protein, partial [Marinobacterium sp.]
MKAFKLIIALLLGLLVLIGLALAALTTLINPNDYKDEIRNAALEQAGIELQIDGDIGWSIYPWLALELNAVGVGYPQKPQLGRLQRAEVSVAIPALISGELQMNRLLIDGLTLDLVQAADGSNNWTSNTLPSAGKDKPTSEQPVPDSGKQPLAIDIEAIEVRNAGLTYTDQRNNSRIELSSLNLTSGQISSGNSFPLELRFALKQFAADQLQLSSTADLSTQVNLDLSSNHYQLNDLTAALELTEGAGLPAALQLTLATSLDARLNEQQIDLRNLNIQADPLTIQGELSLRNFGQPELSGQLSSNRFDLKQLLKTLGQNAPTTADAKALGALSFNTTLSGPAGTVQLKPLQLQLDDTRFDGEASLVL